MSVTYRNGIGFGNHSGTTYIDLSATKAAAKKNSASEAEVPEELHEDNKPWVPWGSDNLKPQQLTKDIKLCGVLNAGIDGKARFGLGNGIRAVYIPGYNKNGSENVQPANLPEVDEFLESMNDYFQCFGWFKDQIGLSKLDARFRLDRAGKKIATVERIDPCTIRYEKAQLKGKNMGKILNVYQSYQWDTALSYDNSKVIKHQLLPTLNAGDYLKEQIDGNSKATQFMYSTFYPSWNEQYYPSPLWTAAYDWVKIAQGVPKMKAAMYENAIRSKQQCIIHEGYWTRNFKGWNDPNIYTDAKKEEAGQELMDEIEKYLTGPANSYKTIFTSGGYNAQTKEKWQDIEFKPIEDSTKPGELLPDSAAANSEILFALMMNPALMGADMPGGPYSGGAGSGSNIREAALVQVMIQELERRQIANILNIVKKVNGWPAELKWRFPTSILTTLDTGSGTKEVAA